MEFDFAYGRNTIPVSIDTKNIAAIVTPKLPGSINQAVELARALGKPINSPPLREIIKNKRPASIVVLVTDISRPVPYQELLVALMEEMQIKSDGKEQIKFVIATGAHRPNTKQEIEEVFGPLAQSYTFINHDCDKDLVSVGKLDDGTELWINKEVAEAEFVIVTSCIMPHNLAGFSGGPKMILPGVAGRSTITANHSMMTRPRVGPGNIQNNPISNQILAAARLLGVDFSLHVVLNDQNRIIKCFAGELEKAWQKGCQYCGTIYRLPFPEPAEVVIAGAGGYPRDLNLYQAVKALINGARLLKPGGTLVLIGECREGMGEPLFKEWLMRGNRPEEMVSNFERHEFILGGHKAYVLCQELKNKEVMIISEFAKMKNPVPFLKNALDWSTAEKMVIQKHGPDYQALLMPLAGLVFPLH
ncbi:nickel-dependent lactate racemase [Desulfotomaculum sp. 1211_IL3151]|uniref:nickel-dependent lactate racemase n=1 Tax=Desulfotomaculum sp. 1211_IL3151 TaxID=3084055 RepID=UPI002FD8EBBB